MLISTKNTLEQYFQDHAQTPRFGFWTEIRHMIREDMSLLKAIKYHNQVWGFKFQDGYVPLTHEIPHQLLAIACVYHPKFSFLLPSFDPKTGFLMPNGYNGFSDGEDFVTSLEHGLLKAIVYQQFRPADLSKSSFMEQIETINDTQPKAKKLERAAWNLAHLESRPTSIHEIKYRYGYDIHDVREAFKAVSSEERLNSKRTSENRYGEAMPVQREFLMDDYERLYDAVINAVEYLNYLYLSQGATLEDIERVWGNVKIRDLHILVAGEKRASQYFESCGVTNTRKAARILAAC